MNIAVYVRRLNQLRYVESMIREAARRGHHVRMVLDDQGETGPKASERAIPEHVPPRFWQWAFASHQRQSSHVVADVVVVPAALKVGDDDGAERLRISRVPQARHRVAVQTSVSDLLRLDPAPWARVFGWSARWAEWWATASGQPRPEIQRAFRAVGWATSDRVHRPPSRSCPAVVYLPLPVTGGSRWQRARHRFLDEPGLVRSIRGFCDRHNAQFIVKSRSKTPIPPVLRREADLVIAEDRPGEATLYDLLDSLPGGVVVHYMSTAVTEAAATGLRALSIKPVGWPVDNRGAIPDLSPESARGFYRWPGVSELTTLSGADFMFSNNAQLLTPPEPSALNAYQAHYLGPLFGAGTRMVDELEALA